MNSVIDHYKKYKEEHIKNRMINYDQLVELLKGNKAEKLGVSVEGKSIFNLRYGSGEKRIMIWSQMHGNESTGTNAMFDLINLLEDSSNMFVCNILKKVTISLIPMVNPDGAELFQRRNKIGIDLNRDFIKKQAPETITLQSAIYDFNPDVCFNLHDQRTIFNVHGASNPAIISFLAPSEDVARSITDGRKQSMGVISYMNNILQNYIPNHIGRYTDEFYPNAFGDNLQKEGYSTVLIEAGGAINDIERQSTRFYKWIALVSGINFIASNNDYSLGYELYDSIPQNDQKMLDEIFRNVVIRYNNSESVVDIGVMYNETLSETERKLIKNAKIEHIGDLDAYFGYKEINAKNKVFKMKDRNYPILNELADFELI